MMKGAVVTNGFLNGRKYDEPAEMLLHSAGILGIDMTHLRNCDLAFPVGNRESAMGILGDVDFVVFWDKDVRCAMNLELCGYRTFNSSECIRLCDDKALTHLVMSRSGIPSIRTVSLPMSFDGDGYGSLGFLDNVTGSIGFPMVVKDCFGSFGQQVRLIDDMDSLTDLLSRRSVPMIAQEYVECGGTDIRIEVVGGEAIAAVRRTAKAGDFRANSTSGGTMSPYVPTDEEIDLAISASGSVGADFCGVDIMESEDGPIVCEINSNAHMKNLRDCTGVDVSVPIMEHIIRTVR